jgi:hypothetical protein
MAARPDKWASHTQSSARAMPCSFKYPGVPLAESVKNVRFRPQLCSQVHSCRVERERRGSQGRRTSRLAGSPQSSLSAEALL